MKEKISLICKNDTNLDILIFFYEYNLILILVLVVLILILGNMRSHAELGKQIMIDSDTPFVSSTQVAL